MKDADAATVDKKSVKRASTRRDAAKSGSKTSARVGTAPAVPTGDATAATGSRRAAAKPRIDGPATAVADSMVSVEARRRMIAEAAYYRACARGFAPGRELEDWVEAEAEIDGRLLRG